MVIVLTIVCVLLTAAAAVWFSPLRPVALRFLSGLNRFKFTCKVQLLVDESKSFSQDVMFHIQMIGKVPVPCDRMDTDVRVELADITESRFQPDPVLSVDPKYRSADEPEFHFVTHNGVIPNKHAAIFPWKTVASIPAHQLRFARRGRRKLCVKVSVLSSESGEVIASDQQTIEYVFCSDGFKDLHDRKMDVLKASIRLASTFAGDEGLLTPPTKQVFRAWIDKIAKIFPAAVQLIEWIETLQVDDAHQAVDCLQAYAQQADKLAAVELTLQVLSSGDEITAEQFIRLSEIVNSLQIKKGRFLALCQKILLFSACRLQAPALLLGIDDAMETEAFRSRLNDEYRKWNARVTHPDDHIRAQADRMLSFIAELRSRRTVFPDVLKVP